MTTSRTASRSHTLIKTLYESVEPALDVDRPDTAAGTAEQWPEVCPELEPETIATATRISIVANRAGRRSIVGKAAAHKQLQRASGRTGTYWEMQCIRTLTRTRDNMVILTTTAGTRAGRVSYSHRLFIDDRAGERETTWRDVLGHYATLPPSAARSVNHHIRQTLGPTPRLTETFPLLGCADSDGFTVTLNDIAHALAHYQNPWVGAHDAAHVAKNLFGARDYRRPLAREVTRLSNDILIWYSQFRGLVPPEWIIDALRAVPDTDQPVPRNLSARHARTVRALLLRTPQPVLRRMLKEPVLPMTMALRDSSKHIANNMRQLREMISTVQQLIDATGHRNIRSSTDLHQLVMNAPVDPRPGARSARSEAASRALNRERHVMRELHRISVERRAANDPGIAWKDWRGLSQAEQAAVLETEHEREREREEHARQQRLSPRKPNGHTGLTQPPRQSQPPEPWAASPQS